MNPRRCFAVPRALLLALIVAPFAVSCAPKRAGEENRQPAMPRYEFTQPAFGQTFRVVVYCPDDEAAREAEAVVVRRLAELEEIFDDREDVRPTSEVSKIHANAGLGAIRVSDELYAFLRQVDDVAKRARGTIDLTTGVYTRMWDKAVETGVLPTDEDIRAADPVVGREKLRLDPINRTVHLTAPGTRLDLRPYVPGYVCDRVLAALRRAGFPSALVDAGDRIAVGDPPPGREAWLILVNDAPPTSPHRVLQLARQAVASSGRVGDHVRVGGVNYSRIVHAGTGRGTLNLAAVTVVARRAWQATALARAAAVLGPDDGEAMLRAVRGAAGWFHFPPNVTTQPAGPEDEMPIAPAEPEPDGERDVGPDSDSKFKADPAPEG